MNVLSISFSTEKFATDHLTFVCCDEFNSPCLVFVAGGFLFQIYSHHLIITRQNKHFFENDHMLLNNKIHVPIIIFVITL